MPLIIAGRLLGSPRWGEKAGPVRGNQEFSSVPTVRGMCRTIVSDRTRLSVWARFTPLGMFSGQGQVRARKGHVSAGWRTCLPGLGGAAAPRREGFGLCAVTPQPDPSANLTASGWG